MDDMAEKRQGCGAISQINQDHSDMTQIGGGMDEGSEMREKGHEWRKVKIMSHTLCRGVTKLNKVIGEALKAHVSMMSVSRAHDQGMGVSGSPTTLEKPFHPNVRLRMTLENRWREIGRMRNIR